MRKSDINEILENINHNYFKDNGVIHNGVRNQIIFKCKNNMEFIVISQIIQEHMKDYLELNEELLLYNYYLNINYYFKNLKIIIQIKEIG